MDDVWEAKRAAAWAEIEKRRTAALDSMRALATLTPEEAEKVGLVLRALAREMVEAEAAFARLSEEI